MSSSSASVLSELCAVQARSTGCCCRLRRSSIISYVYDGYNTRTVCRCTTVGHLLAQLQRQQRRLSRGLPSAGATQAELASSSVLIRSSSSPAPLRY